MGAHVPVPHSHYYSLPVVCRDKGREKPPLFSSSPPPPPNYQPPLLLRFPSSSSSSSSSLARPWHPKHLLFALLIPPLGRFPPPMKTLLHHFPPPLPPYRPTLPIFCSFISTKKKACSFFPPTPASTSTSTYTTHMRTHAHTYIHIHRITSNPLSHTLALCIVH